MADKNLLAPSLIKGLTRTIVIPSTISVSGNIVVNAELLSNPVGSGIVLKINNFSVHNPGLISDLIIDNSSENAFAVTVASGDLVKLVAPPSSKCIFDRYNYKNELKYPPGRWSVIDKNSMIYLQEGEILRFTRRCQDGTVNLDIETYITISYEEVS
jgi:hypothetical protein